jgi:isocitrate/isopropylmalate dehydrogenase
MLEHLGHAQAGQRLLQALEDAIASGARTRDLGGEANTEQMPDAVIAMLQRVAG